MNYTEMNRNVARELHTDLDTVLKEFAAQRNLKFCPSKVIFSETGLKYSVNLELTEMADGKSGAKVEFERYARMHGLLPEWHGMTFTSQGKTFTIAGIRTSARTRPVLATNGGQTFVFKASDIARKMTSFNPNA
jgi:hypothetical protein